MRLKAEDCCAVLIDVQERLFPHIDGHAALQLELQRLVQGLAILELPLLLTEQYPRGLGPTIAPLADCLRQSGYGEALQQAPDKLSFSCCGDRTFMEGWRRLQRPVAILAGIEAHVCVLQTALDLLADGVRVVIVADAVSSRKASHRELALARLRDEGATITSVESLLFELCGQAGTPRFKALSALVK